MERKENGRFKRIEYQPQVNTHKTAYIIINKEDFRVFGSCFKQDLYVFLEISQNTFEKYLKKGENKEWYFKKINNFRIKKR